MTERVTFILVGHCGPDMSMLKRTVAKGVPDAAIAVVDDEASLEASLAGPVVALVNRVLDGDFSGLGGIDVIRDLAASRRCVALLISNYPDAQAAAVQVGGHVGFGKKDLYAPRTLAILAEAAEAAIRLHGADHPLRP